MPEQHAVGRRIGAWWGRLLAQGTRIGPLISHLPFADRAERILLERTWASGSAKMLDQYLVSGYQNPRINLQSILARHVLIARLAGPETHDLMQREVAWAVELNETLRRRAAALGVKMGSYRNPVKHAQVRRVDAAIADREREMAALWRVRLAAAATGSRIRVIELACGSANDYRTFAEAGLAAHLDYLGVDISPINVENARGHHPEARFEVGDIRHLRFADRTFDYVLASDVFEHLSLESMERALDEAVRIARHGLVLTFFNMADVPEHEVHLRRAYHWNRLSRARVEERLRSRGLDTVTAVPIAEWLKRRHGYPHSYNRHAWTILAEHRPSLAASLPHGFVGGAGPT